MLESPQCSVLTACLPACLPAYLPAAGPPQLMMSFTADGQLDPALQQQRDEMHGISTQEVRTGSKQ
jgi:hypothetical protein